MISLEKLVQHLDEYLALDQFRDMAQNGLQVQGKTEVTKVALAVDARLATIEGAAKEGAQLLICHHGLFWGHSELLTGYHYNRIRELITNDLALYAAHLPLDAHAEVGNNAVIARKLELDNITPWAEYKNQIIGFRGDLKSPLTIDELANKLQNLLSPHKGKVQYFGGHQKKITKVGIVSGDAAMELPNAVRDNLDVLITGEPDHIYASLADELQTYLLCGGHYATETFGVLALGEYLKKTFQLETVFIPAPTFA